MNRSSLVRALPVIAASISLSGCALGSAGGSGVASASSSPTQAGLSVAVANLAQAESNLFDGLISLSENDKAINFKEQFIANKMTRTEIMSRYDVMPDDNFTKAKAMRLRVLQQLGNYAQQIDAIEAAASTGWPSAEAQATVTDTGTLITNVFGGTVPATLKTSVSVISTLAQSIVTAKADSDVKKLATNAEASIEQIQGIIKQDDNLYIKPLNASLNTGDLAEEREIVGALYDEKGSAASRLAIANSLSTTLPVIVNVSNQEAAVNDAMSKLVGANQALAAGQKETALSLIEQAAAIANQINADLHPLTPAK